MRILLSCLCIALALLLGAASAARADLTVCSSPDCEVSNHIDTDRTWKAATYRVQEQIQVRAGVTLTLEPGVTLRFTAPEMGLRVEGTLIARGTGETEGQRITFTSGQAAPAPSDWGAVHFTETAVGASFDGAGNYAGGSVLDHCLVEYAGEGGALGAIWAQSPRAPYVYRSTIRDNDSSGVRLEGPPDSGGHSQGVQEARVRESDIRRNRLGDGGGIYLRVASSGTAILSGNTLVGNRATRDGGGIFLRVEASGTATLSANTLLGNSAGRDGGGIHLSVAGTVTLSGNPLLSGNSAGRDGGGISLWVEPSGAATLSGNNTLSGNSAGRDGGGPGYPPGEPDRIQHDAPSGRRNSRSPGSTGPKPQRPAEQRSPPVGERQPGRLPPPGRPGQLVGERRRGGDPAGDLGREGRPGPGGGGLAALPDRPGLLQPPPLSPGQPLPGRWGR